jgi:hypothetical protein
MNKQEFLHFHQQVTRKCYEIVEKKNNDYAGDRVEDNAFANFERIEILGVTSTEVGVFTRYLDKVGRIATFLKKGILEVVDESVEDTICDAINYLIILLGVIQSKKKKRNI